MSVALARGRSGSIEMIAESTLIAQWERFGCEPAAAFGDR
jgi:hypothetical protein